MIQIAKDAINTLDLLLNGNTLPITFVIYYQEFEQTVDNLAHAIEFGRSKTDDNIVNGGLITSDSFETNIEIAVYPRLDGKMSSSGLYKTQANSCSLKVARQYKNNINLEMRASLDNQLYQQLVAIQYDPRNLFIPADATYNLPYDLKNYRIVGIEAIDRDKLNITTYHLTLEQIMVTEWQTRYRKHSNVRPEYSSVQDQGQATSRVIT